MQYINCILCDKDSTEILYNKKDKWAASDLEFNIVKCVGCGLIYINPRPSEEEIVKFYPEFYSWKSDSENGSFFSGRIKKLEKSYRYHLLNYEAKKVARFVNIEKPKLLDIGCGTGDRLDVFRKKGFVASGIEPSSSAEYAKKKLNLNVVQTDIFKANLPSSSVDIITLYHVLEHTHDPRRVLQEIRRILKQNGFLIIQVPNTDSFQYKLFRQRWSAMDVPRDLYYFNSSLINEILEKERFIVVKIDHFSSWWHPPTIVTSMFPGLDPRETWRKEKRHQNAIVKRLIWIFWTLILPPFTLFESLARRSAIITVYARKSDL
jgi:SAM-dependent methyltransferase